MSGIAAVRKKIFFCPPQISFNIVVYHILSICHHFVLHVLLSSRSFLSTLSVSFLLYFSPPHFSLSHSRFLSLFFFYHPFSPLRILSMILFLLPIDYLLFSVICKTCQPVVEGTGDEQLDRDILKTLLARPLEFSVSRFCDGERERATVNVANIAFTPPFFVRITLNHFSLYCSTILYCVMLYNAILSYIVLSRTIVLYCLL